MKEKLTIWSVCKDPGGMAGILPVLDILVATGHTVRLFADGKAIDLLPRLGREFFPCGSVQDVFSRYSDERPDLFLTSMCSGGGVGRDLVPHLRGICPVVALQDVYGARLLTDWAEPIFRPDLICVNDEMGASIVRHAWPDMSGDRIKITGYPALDKYKDFDIGSIGANTRKQFGLNPGKPVVVYCGQVARAGEALKEVVAAINGLRRDIYFIPRQHSRMMIDAPDQLFYWQEAVTDFRGGTLVEDIPEIETSSLLSLADVVLAMYSTVLIEASVLRKQNIAVLYPDVGMKQFRSDFGGVVAEFPPVSLGCTVKASSRPELKDILTSAFNKDLKLELNQSQYFSIDGKNAQRVFETLIYATGNSF